MTTLLNTMATQTLLHPLASRQQNCPTNSTCEPGEEIRFGFLEALCECEPSFVNEGNPDTQDVPIGGSCMETIPIEMTHVSSTSTSVSAQRPGDGDAVQFNLEMFVSGARRESLSVYTPISMSSTLTIMPRLTLSTSIQGPDS